MDARQQVILELGQNRRLAHQTLFKARHPDATPDFHYRIIDRWHSPCEKYLAGAFRGGAKSTLGEEATVIGALYREFNNCVILGESQPRANERLASIKNEFENNEIIEELFGSMVGSTWNEDKIVLSNGVCIQAAGRGVSLRGMKHLDHRPEMLFCDDMENEEAVHTPEARAKMLRYWTATVLPALAPPGRRKIRMTATPLDPEALAVAFAKDPNWNPSIFPIMFQHEDGVQVDGLPNGLWVATWPDRFPLEKIAEILREFARLGNLQEFAQEYMWEAVDPSSKQFTHDMIRVRPHVRSIYPTYGVYDPARTVKVATSSHTGKVVASWIGPKLVVWEGSGHFWKPDEIVNDMFRVNQEFAPVAIGVEEDGLHEFIMQPIRQAQLTRGELLPVRALKAPKGKDDFIKSLQPFFMAQEVEFAVECPDLKEQLLAFPTGRKDVPNALAYFLKMRPGRPMYDGFAVLNVVEGLKLSAKVAPYLLLNSDKGITTGVLTQFVDGSLHILADWVREGDAGDVLGDMVQEAAIEAQMPPKKIRVMAGPKHFKEFDTIGLRAASRKASVTLAVGGAESVGREEIRKLFRLMPHGLPGVQINPNARWVVNGLSAGYAREVTKAGVLTEFAADNVYKTLMEGIETFGALLQNPEIEDTDADRNYAYTPNGRRFLSSRAV